MISFYRTNFYWRTGRVFVVLCLCAALAILAFVAGCGGGNAPAASGGAKTGRGKATVTLEWPAPSRLIPVAAQSVRVAVATPQGQELGARLLKRPPAGGITTATFTDLPVGTLYASATAYASADDSFGFSTPLAFAISPVTVQSGLNAPVALVMVSEIARLQIYPESWSPGGVGERQQFNLQALNAANQTVMTAPTRIKWESSDPAVFTVNDNGQTVTVAPGSASLTITETESGKKVAVPIVVGGETSAAYSVVPLSASDIIYNAADGKIYAALSGGASAQDGRVVKIDPATGQIGSAIFIGPNPSTLALSDDGKYLYVGLLGAHTVVRVNMETNAVDQQFSVSRPPNDDIGHTPDRLYDALRIAVQPGNPNVIAVLLEAGDSHGPPSVVIALYENGAPRAKSASLSGYNYAHNMIWGGTPERVYAYTYTNGGVFESLARLKVDEGGVSYDGSYGYPDKTLLGSSADIIYAGGRLYGTSGNIVDPETFGFIGRCQAYGSVAPAPELNRAFYAQAFDTFDENDKFTQSVIIKSFDATTFALAGQRKLPIPGDRGKLIRWGAHGLAFLNYGQLALLPEAPGLTPPPH